MARYTGPRCRLCRREGMKLFIKGERCFSDKCCMENKSYPPGQHGKRRAGKSSDYRLQLREKEKVRAIYGILENQFRLYFARSARMRGMTGTNLLQLLETRLDNFVYRSGFATSRSAARQLVRHSHINVNGRKINIPSYNLRAGDKVEIREKSKKMDIIRSSIAIADRRGSLAWIELDPDNLTARLLNVPTREEIPIQAQEQLIVELYSK
jgi:small subunit ribosomal protein S4